MTTIATVIADLQKAIADAQAMTSLAIVVADLRKALADAQAIPAPASIPLLPMGSAQAFKVGSVYYSRFQDAIKAIAPGGTLIVKAGILVTVGLGEIPATLSGITIIGDSGDYPIFRSSVTSAKGTFVVNPPNVTLQHLRFENITVGDGNGAGIRAQNPYLTVKDCQASFCENFILTNNWPKNADGSAPAGLITVDGCEIDHCGYYTGQAHGIYMGLGGALTVTNTKFYDGIVGHLLKSRAAVLTVSGCLFREGTASRAIDICNGGVANVDNCQFDQDPTTNNLDIIGYGTETGGVPYWATNTFSLTNSTVSDTRPGGVTVDYKLVPTTKVDTSVAGPAIADIVVPAPVADVVVPFSSGDGFWSSLPIGQVVTVSNTAMTQQLTMPTGFQEFGVTGISGVMSAWCGAGFDPNGIFYCSGGGHMDSSNNGVYAFDVETMKWSITMPPSIITATDVANAKAAWGTGWTGFWQGVNSAGVKSETWPDGKPTAVHTYEDITFGGAVYKCGFSAHMWAIDPATGIPIAGTTSVHNNWNVLSVWDPVNKVIVRCGTVVYDYWEIFSYDPATGASTQRPSLNLKPNGTYYWGTCSGDIVGRELVCTTSTNAQGGFVAFAINLDTWLQRIITLSEPVTLDQTVIGHRWVPDLGLYVAPTASGGMIGIDPENGNCVRLGIKGPMVPSNGTWNGNFGRIRYHSKRKTLVLIPATGLNVRLLRMA